jgi:hypothetical protein
MEGLDLQAEKCEWLVGRLVRKRESKSKGFAQQRIG